MFMITYELQVWFQGIRWLSKTFLQTLEQAPIAAYKQCNFRKANYEMYSVVTRQFVQFLPSPYTECIDKAYQDFFNFLFIVEK